MVVPFQETPPTIAVVKQNCVQSVANSEPLLLVLVQQPVAPVVQNEQRATPLVLDETKATHGLLRLGQLLQVVLVVVELEVRLLVSLEALLMHFNDDATVVVNRR
jgi:hypothetical protein